MWSVKNDAPWMVDSKCAYDQELPSYFFGERWESAKHRKAVKDYCNGCSVLNDCLAYAIQNQESGIWAGTTERERRAMKKKARKAAEEFLARLRGQSQDDASPTVSLDHDVA